MIAERTYEQSVRRKAARRGYTLSKSRRRDEKAPDYGLWTLRRGIEILAETDVLEEVDEAIENLTDRSRGER